MKKYLLILFCTFCAFAQVHPSNVQLPSTAPPFSTSVPNYWYSYFSGTPAATATFLDPNAFKYTLFPTSNGSLLYKITLQGAFTTWKGAWTSSVGYNIGDFVYYNNALYTALQSNTNLTPGSTCGSTPCWQTVLQSGSGSVTPSANNQVVGELPALVAGDVQSRTISQAPVSGTIEVFVNGVRQSNSRWSISGTKLTIIATSYIMDSSDEVVVNYVHQ